MLGKYYKSGTAFVTVPLGKIGCLLTKNGYSFFFLFGKLPSSHSSNSARVILPSEHARALLGGLHAEHLLSRHKRYAGRCGKKNWWIHVSTNWNRIKRTHSNAESTWQKLSGAFLSYPHLGHGLGQRHFRGFYVHVSARCKCPLNKVDSPACGQAASG